MPEIPKMEESELFATAPPEPNKVLSPAESAYGFSGGAAQRDFFNGLINRLSSLIYRNQLNTEKPPIAMATAVSGLDLSLYYRDYFNGAYGTDLTSKTPDKGAVLSNEAGNAALKYYMTGRSSAVCAVSGLYPLYTDCGVDSTNLKGKISFMLKRNPLSESTDFIGICFNCVGRYQRVEVGLQYNKTGHNLKPLFRAYTNNGTVSQTVTGTEFGASFFERKISSFYVYRDQEVGGTVLEIPSLNKKISFVEELTTGGVSDKHGFVSTAQTFEVGSLTFHEH